VVVLTDTHCHLNLNLFTNDLAEVLERAEQQGVKRILVPGVDLETSRQAVRLSEQYSILFAAVGVHPNDATSWNQDTLGELERLAQSPRVVAFGEIGLDYYRDFAPAALQKEIFSAQLQLAASIGKPVVIHSRSSLTDVWQTLERWQQGLASDHSWLEHHPGVLHSYEGNAEIALRASEMGWMIGISGPVTYKNAKDRQSLVQSIPLKSILIETDSPYLPPHPFRGQRNEPGYVAKVAEKIAELRNLEISEVAEITSANSNLVFGWRLTD
jgi:TatD DNase family protein